MNDARYWVPEKVCALVRGDRVSLDEDARRFFQTPVGARERVAVDWDRVAETSMVVTGVELVGGRVVVDFKLDKLSAAALPNVKMLRLRQPDEMPTPGGRHSRAEAPDWGARPPRRLAPLTPGR